MERITRNNCQSVADRIAHRLRAHGLMREGESLHVEAGSVTYGRAWRVALVGVSESPTAHYRPACGELRSGSARELWEKLHAVNDTLLAFEFYARG